MAKPDLEKTKSEINHLGNILNLETSETEQNIDKQASVCFNHLTFKNI